VEAHSATSTRPQVGETLELTVDCLAYGGAGVARAEGYVVFVRGGLPGDRVRARVTKSKRSFAEADSVELLDPSPDRVEPVAPHPGAAWQVLSYERQLAEKESQVRDALERIGGFDERFTAAWREDSDLQFSILRAGGRVMRADTALVVHPVRPAPWGVSISQVRKSHFDALLYKKHADYYRTRIAATPWNYYLIVAALAVTVLAALAGRPGISAAAGTLWLILTLAFAARRLRATSLRPAHVAEMLWTSIVIPPLAVAWRLYGACKFRVAFF